MWLCRQGLEGYFEQRVEPLFDRNRRKDIKRWLGWMVSLYPLDLSLSIWQITSIPFSELSLRFRKTTEILSHYCVCHRMSLLFSPRCVMQFMQNYFKLWTDCLESMYTSYCIGVYITFANVLHVKPCSHILSHVQILEKAGLVYNTLKFYSFSDIFWSYEFWQVAYSLSVSTFSFVK